ncbi:bifunctional metallophosphatase/5'-nucleotidase [Ruminiclostridium cellulolyticum]|uniref:5'-Nucleotidase domain protein n=1 Tax=Ruminiclostridium cellulolyticum (strain ATCC 35319 / DSM 5812 / JCM 6584 / H10) TaxID=394503 RepID=B8I682_RUMCH|nr:5'-nucleotidase C-terminal domain-containing protein [Ruminiclostridium cellulolyticum]ACL76847.1 5'-Nucleotidase domain protein [Ruminiclostridium cellulolyticum H10]
MKSYKNLIVIGVLIFGIAVFLVAKYVNFNDLLKSVGYYEEKISVVSTADIHGHIIFDEEAGGYYSLDDVSVMMGMPLMKNLIDDIKEKNKNTLVLDSGDMFHGTNEANINKAEGVVQVANLMGFDAMTPGNHDFNFGYDRLVQIKDELRFPILSANIYKDGKPAFQEYKIVKVGGKKIGLFGMTEQNALINTNSRETKGVTLEDPVRIANKMVSTLKGKVDAIVLISHLGDDIDRKVVKQVDGIDLILCGHHHFLYEKADKINNTYLVEAGGYSTHVGLADMYFKDGKLVKVVWSSKRTKDKEKADPIVNKVAEKYHAVALESSKVVVGKTKEKLDGFRSNVRSKETTLANLLCDAMRETAGADLALMNGGGIRESIPAGNINLYAIGKSLPFVNSLVTIALKGENIYTAVERGVRLYPDGGSNGGFLQVSGIKYTFDASKPAGKRLVSITINGKPLDREKYYKVATNDYLYNGGDGYDELKEGKLLSKGELLKDVLAKYIKEKGDVSAKIEGRIKVINERYK